MARAGRDAESPAVDVAPLSGTKQRLNSGIGNEN
jgi:hypothetical protein